MPSPFPNGSDVILVAEDEATDAIILEHALRKSAIPYRLKVVSDGEDVIAYLTGVGVYADREQYPMPQLLLLDLKMPRMTGFDVLKWLADRPEFSGLPRLILSSSCHESDIERAHQLGASEYHIKPGSLSALVEFLKGIHERWLVTRPA